MYHNTQLLTRANNDQEIISLWLQGKSRTTIMTYQCHIKQFMSFIDKPLSEVMLDDLYLWLNGLNLRYKPVTVANKLLAVKSLFSFAFKVGYLGVNIGSLVKTPKLRDSLSQRILDKSEVRALIDAAKNERDRLLLSLMYGCGLRVSEICSLNWSDLHNGRANIFGKGSKNRVVIIPQQLWTQLMAMKPNTGVGDTPVFISYRGKRLERTGVHKIIKETAKIAGISEKASSHWLRHSHASHAINNGCNIRLLQQSLGHSKLETTEKYLHVNENEGSSQFIDL